MTKREGQKDERRCQDIDKERETKARERNIRTPIKTDRERETGRECETETDIGTTERKRGRERQRGREGGGGALKEGHKLRKTARLIVRERDEHG